MKVPGVFAAQRNADKTSAPPLRAVPFIWRYSQRRLRQRGHRFEDGEKVVRNAASVRIRRADVEEGGEVDRVEVAWNEINLPPVIEEIAVEEPGVIYLASPPPSDL